MSERRFLSQRPTLNNAGWLPVTAVKTGVDQVISSTSAADLVGLTTTVQSPGPQAIWRVTLSLDISVAGGAGYFTTTVVADGTTITAGGAAYLNSAAFLRVPYFHTRFVTGVAAGSRVIKAQGALAIAGSNFTVGTGSSVMLVERIA